MEETEAEYYIERIIEEQKEEEEEEEIYGETVIRGYLVNEYEIILKNVETGEEDTEEIDVVFEYTCWDTEEREECEETYLYNIDFSNPMYKRENRYSWSTDDRDSNMREEIVRELIAESTNTSVNIYDEYEHCLSEERYYYENVRELFDLDFYGDDLEPLQEGKAEYITQYGIIENGEYKEETETNTYKYTISYKGSGYYT